MFPIELLWSIGKDLLIGIFGFGVKWFWDRKKTAELQKQLEDAKAATTDAITTAGVETRRQIQQFKDDAKEAYSQLAVAQHENGKVRDQLAELKSKLDARSGELIAGEGQLDSLLTTLSNSETNLWQSRKAAPPFENYNSRISRHPVSAGGPPRPAIITLVNYKGGVGKTTTTGNLAAYFDKKLGKRVLLLDLDYQGSLSTMLRSAITTVGSEKRNENIQKLFSPGASAATFWNTGDSLAPTLQRSHLVQSFYEFARLEDQLMIQWLLLRMNDDLRYRLARVLLDDEIGKKFDVVLIDAPPRLTTASINALCASTHVLVPTIVSSISAEPVLNFLQQTRNLMDVLNPKLVYLGVVETMTPDGRQKHDDRNKARGTLEEGLKKSFKDIDVLTADIPRKPALSEGGLAYLKKDSDVTSAFNALGDELVRKIGLLP